MTAIRRFEPEDVDFALRQKLREGWAISREQFTVLLQHDPDGCFVAEADDRPVGMVTTTRFGQSGWIGNLIVEPDVRGRGIGRALMEHGIEHLHQQGAPTVRLEGDPPGIPLYRKLGFVDEFESCRFVLHASGATAASGDPEVEATTHLDLDEVASLDAELYGADRRRFLELKKPVAELAIVRRRGGRVVASLMAAPTDRGFRVGPCVALERADARILIAATISAAGGQPVIIGVPAPNTEGVCMLSEIGFLQLPSSQRMRLGPPVATGDPTRVFAISSGAVG